MLSSGVSVRGSGKPYLVFQTPCFAVWGWPGGEKGVYRGHKKDNFVYWAGVETVSGFPTSIFLFLGVAGWGDVRRGQKVHKKADFH